MDTVFTIDIEEQQRLEQRRARREQMQREKKLQMERRRKMKKIIMLGSRITFAAVAFIIVALCSLGVFNTFYKESEEGKGKEKIWQTFDFIKETQTQELLSQEDAETDMLQEEKEELSQSQPNMLASVQLPKQFQFQSSEEKKYIYNEEIISTNAILIDESKDIIVAAKGEKERISPASMTKVLTLLVAAEHITYEQLEDTLTMTLEITDYGFINDCSSVGFLEGEQVTVRDLFYGTILPSGADAALGLAIYAAGSHEAFVELMNEKLKELGLEKTSHFTNCVGIYDQNHYSTVYDMAVIMKAAIANEFCREVLSCKTYTTKITPQHPEGITISNWFLRRIEDKETGGTVLGAKTGFVNQSGSCAVSYGSFQSQTPYICVTVGAYSSWRCIYDHVEIYNRYVAAA